MSATANAKEMDQLVDELASCTSKISLTVAEQDIQIPSKHLESYWIWAETSDEIYSRLDDEMGGKWLIFLNNIDRDENGLSKLDLAWKIIEKATLEKVFYQAKVSTGNKEPHARGDTMNGVIVIYTKDFEDVADVKKVADDIFNFLNEILPSKAIIRYKTNAATDARQYPSLNCQHVTLYQYTKRYGLQEKNEKNFWVNVQIGVNPFVAEGAKIPSSHLKSNWIWAETWDKIQKDDEMGGKWLIFLNNIDRDENGLTQLDLAWKIIEKATLERVFYKAKVSTGHKKTNAGGDTNNGVIMIYTKDFRDFLDVIKVASDIFKVLNKIINPKAFIKYKTNAATDARQYPHLNGRNVTLYQYNNKFGLQEKNEENTWVTV